MNLDEACRLVNDNTEVLYNKFWRYSGFLVADGKQFALVAEEFDGYKLLPVFLKTEDEVKSYLTHLEVEYVKGQEEGERIFKRRFSEFMGLTSKDTYNTFIDMIDKKIERLEAT